PAAWNFSSRGGGGATKTRRRGRRAARPGGDGDGTALTSGRHLLSGFGRKEV
ncbi:hypothetical protein EE612_051695, partial [Oryza sativa]